MLVGAPRNAVRAFNAGVSLSCLYGRRPQTATLALRRGGCSLCFSPTGKSGHGAPAVRLGTGRMCPILPYAAPPLTCAAFFVKEQTGQIYAKRKGVKRFAFTYLP